MVLSQQAKLNVLITNKNGKYKLTNELPNNVRLKENLKTPWKYILVPSLLSKLKTLPILARNYQNLDIKLWSERSTLHETLCFSQIFY